MMPSQVPEDDVSDAELELLGPFILAYEEAIEAGRTPPVMNDSTLTVEMRAKLRQSLSCLNLLVRGRRHDSGQANSTELKRPAAPAPLQIGRFDVLGELGRGGFGIVFLARDTLLGREVALKMPRPEVLVTVDLQQRFIREAQAAASLEHPNIVAVYEVGEDGPLCYIASAVCRGPTLNAWRKSQSSPVPLRLAAEWMAQLADAVAHAHQRGVLHRDLKPSNVLLDPVERSRDQASVLEYLPRLTDFGLARSIETADELTRTGALLGTPAYMSPEQAEGRTQDISVATDIYGLGIMLYELVTGSVPFVGKTDVDTLRRVAIGEIARPRRVRPETPPDLEAILLKCLQRMPADRYESAAALAADLRRFLTGMPTLARPLPASERLGNWVRRKPAVAALVAVSILASLSLGIGGWWYSAQLRTSLLQTQQRELETRHQLYTSDLNGAWRALDSNHWEEAVKLLEGQIPRPGESDLREFTWEHLWHRTHEERLSIAGHQGDIYSVQFSPDGRSLVTASQDRTACVWDAETGQRQLLLEGHAGDVNGATFSPDGAQVASASDDGRVRIWNRADGKLLANWIAHEKGANQVLYVSPELLASCGRDQVIRLWNPATWTLVGELAGHDQDVECLAIAKDGVLLASGSIGHVKLWHLPSCEELGTLSVGQSAVACLALSSDGSRLLVGDKGDRAVSVWSVAKRTKLVQISKHYAWVHAAAWIHGEHEVVVATKDGELKSFDAQTGVQTHAFAGHRERVWSVAVSPDGQSMASAGADKALKIWSLSKNLSHFNVECYDAVFVNELRGTTFVNAGEAGLLWVWDVCPSPSTLTVRNLFAPAPSGPSGTRAPPPADTSANSNPLARELVSGAIEIHRLAMSGDANLIATCNGADSWIELWDLKHASRNAPSTPDAKVLTPDELAVSTSHLRFFRDSAGTARYGLPVIHTPTILRPDISQPSQRECKCSGLTFSPDGKFLVSSDTLGQLTVWDLRSRAALQTIPAHASGKTEVVFSPGGDIVASSGDEGTIKLWSSRTWLMLHTLLHEQQGELRAMAFSADGAQLATGGSNRIITLWDVASGQPMARLTGHSKSVNGLAISPDGRTLASTSDDNTVRLWDLSTQRELITVPNAGEYLKSIYFSEDGQLLIWVSAYQGHSRIHVWSTTEQQPARAIQKSQVELPANPLSQPVVSAPPARVGDEFRVNSATRGDQEYHSYSGQPVAIDEAGNSVITWYDTGMTFAQRYNAAGKTLGPAVQVNGDSNGDICPSVAMNTKGEYVIVWQGADSNYRNSFIFARRFAADGRALGVQSVVCASTVYQAFPTVAMDAVGNYIVSWSRYPVDVTDVGDVSRYEVIARRYDVTSGWGSEFQVNATTPGTQYYPRTAMNAAGDCVITWESLTDSPTGRDIFARHYEARSKSWGDELPISVDPGDQSGGSVALDAAGSFIVAWATQGQAGGRTTVAARRFNSAGAPVGGPFSVNCATDGEQRNPGIAMDDTGGFVVTWNRVSTDPQPTTNAVLMRHFSSRGVPLNGEEQVNTYNPGRHDGAAIAMNATGEFVVVWNSPGQDGDGNGVYAQRYARSLDTVVEKARPRESATPAQKRSSARSEK